MAGHIQPGHPHGFHAHSYLGEVHHSRPLFDPSGVLTDLKRRVDPHPERLAWALVETYSSQAYTALGASEKSVARAESAYIAGCFFECAYCLIQVLFALNRRFFDNEKGALEEVMTFGRVPIGFAQTVHEVLAQPGASAQALQQSWNRMRALASEVGKLARPGA